MTQRFFSTILLVTALLFGANGAFNNNAQAQNSKIGFVNYSDLLMNLPEIAQADEELRALTNTWEERIEEDYNKFQAKFQQYMTMAEQGLLSRRQIEEKDQELDKDREALIALQTTMEQQIRQKRRDLLTPLLSKLEQAVREVAIENGYNYILDASAGDLLFVHEANDVGPKVKERYQALRGG